MQPMQPRQPRQPTDEESFHNHLDYKDELERKYSRLLGTSHMIPIYNAVNEELRDRNLINEAVYENHKETITFLGDDDTCCDYLCLSLASVVITFLLLSVYVLVQIGRRDFDDDFDDDYDYDDNLSLYASYDL